MTDRTITLPADDWRSLDSAIDEAIEGRHPANYEDGDDPDSKAVVRSFKALKKRLADAIAAAEPKEFKHRYLCKKCRSPLQVCVRAWFEESMGGELRHVDTDSEDTSGARYCPECNDTDDMGDIEVVDLCDERSWGEDMDDDTDTDPPLPPDDEEPPCPHDTEGQHSVGCGCQVES